ncbi:MAG: glycosyltransferase family 9 protein [Planctomycetota bacterium]|jgi:lipopolysaccharide heptosyltransferase I
MSKRVLIVRLSAVGDTILSLPIACALRRHLPEIELGWVVARGASDLIVGHDCLDQVFVLPPDALRSPSVLVRFGRKLKAWKPDVVIDAQGLTKSAILGWLSGARQRIGLAKSEFEGRELSTWINNTIVTPESSHVIDRGLELLRPLGISQSSIEYRIPDFLAIRDRVRNEAQTLGWRFPGAIINVGAGWTSKVWPSDRYAAVARHLADRWGLLSCIVWGGAREKQAAEEVVALSEGSAVLAPPTTLPELAEWIRCSGLFLGSDTGPMHLACALDIPTVGLIGPMPVERVGPKGTNRIAVQRLTLKEGQRAHRKTDCGPMLSIDVAGVVAACDSLLSEIQVRNVAA